MELRPLAAILALGLSPGLQSQPPQFKSQTLAVRVDVLATDGRKPAASLAAADFELRDNGVIQTIEVVETDGVPVSVVLALDTSASIDGKRQSELVSAANALLDDLHRADRAALLTFSHSVKVDVPMTTDLARIRTALDTLQPAGRTAIMDVVHTSLALTLGEAGRSLVVVCTDGNDISSWLQPGDVVESARRSNAVVYSVATADARSNTSLDAIVDTTGGRRLRVKHGTDLKDAFDQILREFRSRYVLSYTPAGVQPGGFHRLEVRTTRRALKVQARPGYVGIGQVP